MIKRRTLAACWIVITIVGCNSVKGGGTSRSGRAHPSPGQVSNCSGAVYSSPKASATPR